MFRPILGFGAVVAASAAFVAAPAAAATATETILTADTPVIVLADGVSKSGPVNLDAKSTAIGGGADVTVQGATYVFRRDGGTIPSSGDTASVTGLGCGAHTFTATLSAPGYESSAGTATVEVTGSACGTPPVEPVEPTGTTEPIDKPGDVYYDSCWDVRAAGKAPLKPGEPGFRPILDEDDDGLACEDDDAKPGPEPTTPTATVTTTATVTPTTAPACASCGASCTGDCTSCGASCTGCDACKDRAARLVFAPAPDVYVEAPQTQTETVYYFVQSGAKSSTGGTVSKPDFTG